MYLLCGVTVEEVWRRHGRDRREPLKERMNPVIISED